MNHVQSPLIPQLLALSKIDIAIARTKADLASTGKKVELHKQQIAKILNSLASQEKVFEDSSLKYRGEERWLRDEQQKLVDRRKGLATLNNYKLQQSAEKEIEKSSYQLSLHEERLLASLDKLELQEKEIVALKTEVQSLQTEIEKLEADTKDELQALTERLAKKTAERNVLAAELDPKILRDYDAIRQRFTMDPIVGVKNNTCSGCHMSVPRQLIVMISRGEDIHRCRGCARILFLEEPIS